MGRFHAFDLARELNNNGYLNKLITTYPKFKVREWGISNDKIISEIPLEILNRMNIKSKIRSPRFNNFLKTTHARNNKRHLDDCDVFIGWSSSSLNSLIECNRRGILSILERGSSHYSYQQKILTEEHERNDSKFNTNYYSWEKELLEYELADYISVPSTFVKSTFIEYGIPEEKLIVNPYGVDIGGFQQVEKGTMFFASYSVETYLFKKVVIIC